MIFKSYRLGLMLLLLFCLSACDKQAKELSWDRIFRTIEAKFPDVPQLSTEGLFSLLNSAKPEVPLLLDARTREEYVVSHLGGAYLFSSARVEELLATTSKDRTFVVYCSVGWRSAEVVQQLQTLGYTNSYNLKGSIFEWANRGKPLVNEKGATQVVHPYGYPWASLLNPELHANGY